MSDEIKQEKKKRPPIEQLLAAGEEARKALVKRGILMAENLVEKTKKEKPNLILPGMPSYIPHKYTIKVSQRMMYDLLKSWQLDNKSDTRRQDNLTLFIEYTLNEMKKIEEIAEKKMKMQPFLLQYLSEVPTLGKVFEPIRQKEVSQAMAKWFFDSFAVCIIVKGQAATTSEFAEWFLNWTEDLYTVWEKKEVKSITSHRKKNKNDKTKKA